MPVAIRLLLKRSVVAAFLILSFVLQGTTSVLAGTTGSITGIVTDSSTQKPISGASVNAISASQSATAKSDSAGRFTFISLAPDTYVISVAAAPGRDAYSLSGITVQADQTQSVTLTPSPTLQTIGHTTSRAASALVKPGTTVDVYSISAAAQDKAAVLSGGGLLNSAWSAITSVPGVFVAPGSNGYIGAGSGVSIRGGDYDQIGYELDGVPVNRSYDNYPSGKLSSLGQQELQVYTGAAPSNSEGQGISGYINQVIKTGTAPAYRSIDLAVGAPTMYNKGTFETGGANPSRTFSYYVGLGGYNQNYRTFDQFNGAGLSRTWGPPIASCQNNPGAPGYTSPSLAPSCYSPSGADYTNGGNTAAYVLAPMNTAPFVSRDEERDNVVNLHFGIPHKDGNKDDVQFLWDASGLKSNYYNSANDFGGPAYMNAIGVGQPTYSDRYSYVGAPLGATVPVGSIANGVIPAFFPSSPTGRALNANIAPNMQDNLLVDQSVLKLQYQHNFGTSAYLRVSGYTFYSDWLENSPNSTYYYLNSQAAGVSGAVDYNVGSHMHGVSAQFSDQLNDKHLLTIQGNYSVASVYRSNGTNRWLGSGSQYAVLVDPNNLSTGQCYGYSAATQTATKANCYNGTAYNSGATFLTTGNAYAGKAPAIPAGTMCGTSACQYLIIGNGQVASFNDATPKFGSISFNDNWKPTDKLTVNYGIRYDSYQFVGDNPYNSSARQFLFAAYNSQPLAQSNPSFYPQIFDPNSVVSEQFPIFQPRLAFTYSVDPTTVLRASYGRYGQPPLDAFEQYNYVQPNAIPGIVGFARAGISNSFMHRIVPPVSNNFDFSYEKQLKGDLSLKFTPFLRQTQNQIESFVLDQRTNFVSGLNVGNQRSQGVELEVDKGDFARNGIAARLSFSYTNSYIRYNRFNGVSVVDAINGTISGYNALTKGGGGSACYTLATATTAGVATPCGPGTVANPYYNMPTQSTLDANANYAPFSTFPVGTPAGAGYQSYEAPYVGTLLVQYKKDRFAITPALQFVAGQRYGVPITTPGIDPTACTAILGSSTTGDPRYPGGAVGGSPYDATSCGSITAIPNPLSGRFDSIGQYVQPAIAILHLQASYDVSKRITLVANFANLYAKCFGGSKVPWSVGGACSYGTPLDGSGIAPYGNAYNPGFNLQPVANTPYGPGFGASPPFNAYIEARIKM
jgi:TonB dependent receptor/Carboxypeptidase regulatory-like domain/TonB-dependent Receptor Plug Domain